MNIAVLTAGGKVIVRPDTTRVKDGEDVYLPEFVSAVEWTPVLYARICKSGRSVGKKFAERYFDGFNFGVLLYPTDLMDGSEESFACASCLDHTSVLNLQFLDKKEANSPNNKTVINTNNYVLNIDNLDIIDTIEKSIVEITKFCWLRVGDLIAVEIQPRKRLCERSDSPVGLSVQYGQRKDIDIQIIL